MHATSSLDVNWTCRHGKDNFSRVVCTAAKQPTADTHPLPAPEILERTQLVNTQISDQCAEQTEAF